MNWWYGPEHHSANDRDFDELYRKHLSNVYQALGATPPDYLTQPITAGEVRPAFTPQTAYIHPRITGDKIRYFEWMGAAIFTADQRAGAMHGKQFLLDSVYAGIDSDYVYGRLDFSGAVPSECDLVVNLEAWVKEEAIARKVVRIDANIQDRKLASWKIEGAEKPASSSVSKVEECPKAALLKSFEFRLPLSWLQANAVTASDASSKPGAPGTPLNRLSCALACGRTACPPTRFRWKAGSNCNCSANGSWRQDRHYDSLRSQEFNADKKPDQVGPVPSEITDVVYCPVFATTGVIASGRFNSMVSVVPAGSVAE